MFVSIKPSTRAATRFMLGASLSALAMSPGAYAQSQVSAANVESVTVTGTLIRGINPVGTSAVTVDAGDIAATGQVRVDRILETVPQVSSSFNSVPVLNGNLSAGRGTIARIRNLSTRLLVDGHNMVGVGALSSSTDMSEIPSIARSGMSRCPDGLQALRDA
jgi:iron complex outermembrane receptor protein